MATNSMRKGKRFEREVAKTLTELTGMEWKRVPISGAFSTRTGSTRPEFKGDIFTDDEQFRNIVVECKITKHKISLSDLIRKNNKRKVWQWVEQTEKEAGEDTPWILVFRDGSRRTYVLTKSVYKYNAAQRLYVLIKTITKGVFPAVESMGYYIGELNKYNKENRKGHNIARTKDAKEYG